MPLIRLDKLLADMGIGSRKDIREIIKSGRVYVDGKCVLVPDLKLDTYKSKINLDGKEIEYSKFHYYMMNKPSGIVTATEDGKQRTVLDIVTPEMRRMDLFPVGRLDKDTSGLLLLTNDGDFAHRVISPKSCIEKVYLAKVQNEINTEDVRAFQQGLILGDGTKCLPAKLDKLENRFCLVAVMEGKYHQVKRMLASRGKPVVELKRLSIGGLKLDESLEAGGFRELTQQELDSIFIVNQ